MEHLTWTGPWTKLKIAWFAGIVCLGIAMIVIQCFGLMGPKVDWMVLPVFLYWTLTNSKPIIRALRPTQFKGSGLKLFGMQLATLALFLTFCILCAVLPATACFGVFAVAVWYLYVKKAYMVNLANGQSLPASA